MSCKLANPAKLQELKKLRASLDPSRSTRSSSKSSIVTLSSLIRATLNAPSLLPSQKTTSAPSKNTPFKLYPIPSASPFTSAKTNYPRVRFLMSRRFTHRVRFLNGLTGAYKIKKKGQVFTCPFILFGGAQCADAGEYNPKLTFSTLSTLRVRRGWNRALEASSRLHALVRCGRLPHLRSL